MFWQDVIVDRILTKAELSDAFSKVFQVDGAKVDITSNIEHSLGVGIKDIVCETRKCEADYPLILSIFLKNEPERETHDLIKEVCSYLNCNALISDSSINPLSMILIKSTKENEQVYCDLRKFDENTPIDLR
ncbi:hypothetical protein GCM10023310_18400 [Paenibacillus vulneris]|uniref:Uncharacterized protein n=1 Tax=Paenibacillus vulneris TaxID=1133364 RepID=A0ABW3UIF4_9BACL